MRGLLATLIVVGALAVAAAPALGQGAPFAPLPPSPIPAPAPAPSSPSGSSSGSGGGLSGWQSTLIYLGAALLLGGIGLMIVLDAREKARTAKSHGPTDPERSGRDPHRERAKQQQRRKQKAARAQRRRNR